METCLSKGIHCQGCEQVACELKVGYVVSTKQWCMQTCLLAASSPHRSILAHRLHKQLVLLRMCQGLAVKLQSCCHPLKACNAYLKTFIWSHCALTTLVQRRDSVYCPSVGVHLDPCMRMQRGQQGMLPPLLPLAVCFWKL